MKVKSSKNKTNIINNLLKTNLSLSEIAKTAGVTIGIVIRHKQQLKEPNNGQLSKSKVDKNVQVPKVTEKDLNLNDITKEIIPPISKSNYEKDTQASKTVNEVTKDISLPLNESMNNETIQFSKLVKEGMDYNEFIKHTNVSMILPMDEAIQSKFKNNKGKPGRQEILDKVPKIIELAKQGVEVKEIAKQVDLGITTVYSHINLYNKGVDDEVKIGKSSTAKAIRIIELLKTDKTIKQIADEVGVNKGVVHYYKRKFKSSIPGIKDRKPKLTQEKADIIVNLLKSDLSVQKIAEAVGVSTGSVYTCKYRNPPIPSNRKTIPHQLSEEEAKKVRELSDSGHTQAQIGKMMNRDRKTIAKYINQPMTVTTKKREYPHKIKEYIFNQLKQNIHLGLITNPKQAHQWLLDNQVKVGLTTARTAWKKIIENNTNSDSESIIQNYEADVNSNSIIQNNINTNSDSTIQNNTNGNMDPIVQNNTKISSISIHRNNDASDIPDSTIQNNDGNVNLNLIQQNDEVTTTLDSIHQNDNSDISKSIIQ